MVSWIEIQSIHLPNKDTAKIATRDHSEKWDIRDSMEARELGSSLDAILTINSAL
jgi:hypothetical protein